MCYIKSSLGTPTITNGITTYLPKGTGTANGLLCSGGDVSNVSSTGIEDCRAKILAARGVNSGQFDPSSNICYLKSSLTATGFSSKVTLV
jgi:hypothetical protein